MEKPRPLAGTTVVITGAGSGIGRALAARLSAQGCPVALVDANATTLEASAAALTGPVLTRVFDVRDTAAQHDFAAAVTEWAPAPIGAVFNNAGVEVMASVRDGSPEDAAWLMGINFDGVVNGVRAYLPALRRQGSGTIANTSSIFGLTAIPFQSAYCASKFAVRGFTEALRHELRGTGVRALTIHPGGVRTNVARNWRLTDDPRGLGRSSAEIAAEYERFFRTTPERAAEIIHRGVDAGKARILVGADAHVIEALTRIAPVNHYKLVHAIEELVHRFA